MLMRNRVKNPDAIIRIGLVFLILASLWRWFVHANATLSEGIVDGGTGLLYGVTIGALLLGIWLKARRDRSPS
jgi:hypothetical protein